MIYMTSTKNREQQSRLLEDPLSPDELRKIDSYWQACNSDPGQTFTWVHLNRVICLLSCWTP